MYCIKCGKELPDDANFCNSCGYSFNSTQNNTIENKVSPNPSTNNQAPIKTGPNWFLFFIRLLLFGIGCIFMLILFMKLLADYTRIQELTNPSRDENRSEAQSIAEETPIVKTMRTAEEVADGDIVKAAALQCLINNFFIPQGLTPEIKTAEIEESDEYGRYIVSVNVKIYNYPYSDYLVYICDVTSDEYSYTEDSIQIQAKDFTKKDLIELMKAKHQFGVPFKDYEQDNQEEEVTESNEEKSNEEKSNEEVQLPDSSIDISDEEEMKTYNKMNMVSTSKYDISYNKGPFMISEGYYPLEFVDSFEITNETEESDSIILYYRIEGHTGDAGGCGFPVRAYDGKGTLIDDTQVLIDVLDLEDSHWNSNTHYCYEGTVKVPSSTKKIKIDYFD